jgi:hypothetical protein
MTPCFIDTMRPSRQWKRLCGASTFGCSGPTGGTCVMLRRACQARSRRQRSPGRVRHRHQDAAVLAELEVALRDLALNHKSLSSPGRRGARNERKGRRRLPPYLHPLGSTIRSSGLEAIPKLLHSKPSAAVANGAQRRARRNGRGPKHIEGRPTANVPGATPTRGEVGEEHTRLGEAEALGRDSAEAQPRNQAALGVSRASTVAAFDPPESLRLSSPRCSSAYAEEQSSFTRPNTVSDGRRRRARRILRGRRILIRLQRPIVRPLQF